MITNFGEIQLSEYRPEYRGLPVQEFSESMDKLEHRYDQNLMATEQLREHVEALNVEKHNKGFLDEAAQNLYGVLTNLVEGGNLEYAERDLLRAARDFKNAPLLKDSLESYAAYRAWLADIQERELDLSDPDRMNQWNQLYEKNAKTLEYDKEGNVINKFNLPKPVDTPDIAGIVDEFLKGWEASTYPGTSMSGDPNNPQLQERVNLGDYIRFGSTKIRAGDPMFAAARDRLLQDPTVKAYVDELYMLDRNLNSADILTRLNNVGLDNTGVALNLIDRNVISEGDHFDNITKIRGDLNAQVDIINNHKTTKAAREAAVAKYNSLNKELDAAAKAKFSGRVLEDEEYIQTLEGMYYDGFVGTKLSSTINSYVKKYESIEHIDKVVDNWRVKEDYKHGLALQRQKLENLGSTHLGEAGVMSYTQEDIFKGLEDYRTYKGSLTEIDAVLATLEPGTAEYNTKKGEKDRLEALKNNYVTMVNTRFDELVSIDPEIQKHTDESYRNYLRDHREFQNLGEGDEWVIAKPLSKEEFILEAMTDVSSRGTNTAAHNTATLREVARTGDINNLSRQLAINSIRGNKVDFTALSFGSIVGSQVDAIRQGVRQIMGKESIPTYAESLNQESSYINTIGSKSAGGRSLETRFDRANRNLDRQGLESSPIPYWFASDENGYARVAQLNKLGSDLTAAGNMLDGSGIPIYESLANRFNKEKDINLSAAGLSTTRTANYSPDQLSKLFNVDARIIRTPMRGGIGFSVQFTKEGKALVDKNNRPITVEVYPKGNNEREVIQLINNAIYDPLYNPQTAYMYKNDPSLYSTYIGAKEMQLVIGLGLDLSNNNIDLNRLKQKRPDVSWISSSGLKWDIKFQPNGEFQLISYDRSGRLSPITTRDNPKGEWFFSDFAEAAMYYEQAQRVQAEAAQAAAKAAAKAAQAAQGIQAQPTAR